MASAHLVVDCGATLGESAVWHSRAQQLYWLDLAVPTIFRFDSATGETIARPVSGQSPLGGLALSVDDDKLVLVKREGAVLYDPGTGDETNIAHPLRGRQGLAYNDAGVDRAGRLWVGTLDEAETEPHAEVFVVHADGSWTSAVKSLVICNGPAFSLDGSVMYLSDTVERVVRAYDVHGDGRVAGSRIFAHFTDDDGLPDGLAVDADGALWVAHWGGGRVSRWSDGGQRVDDVEIPTANVTSVAFGGSDLSRLYVTTAKDPYNGAERAPLSGALFAVDTAVPGVETTAFAMPS
ncbi:SMP-30/gluconolactonase/LRE family protein [Diaminobutyricibacter tongyongensis]|uniref:SMP-30/gluconolactonase/LRE family protein n=1 Tax=Leifsonia tongyongensis TaxID=1268043 RepID=A0A6L9XTM6_9MICO|nr:SMP-30/gluconolactonase/LRE family protein [Diaminobutyricibacter tongyongensis]